jgi:sugar phosphate isomerase/epimerase
MRTMPEKIALGAVLFSLSDVFAFYRRTRRFPGLADIEERLREIRAHGISVLEIPIHEMGFFPDVFTPQIMRKSAQKALDLGFILSAHVPLPGVQLVSHLEETRRASVAIVAAAGRLLRDFPVRCFVTHIEGEFFEWMDKDAKGEIHTHFSERAFETGSRSIREVLRVIPRENLLLENLPRTNLRLLRRWAERFKIGICLDVGHIHLARKDLRRSVLQLVPHIKHVHLHDIVRKRSKSGRQYLEDHRALGTGILDLELFLALRRNHFPDAPLILEQRWHWAKISASILQNLHRR